jgi:hypothetical protein
LTEMLKADIIIPMKKKFIIDNVEVSSDTMEELMANAQGLAAGLMTKYDASPLVIAGTFAALALQIYRSSLTREDYDSLVDAISEHRDEVKTFPVFLEDDDDRVVH